jgi:Domain of unknown function (DUF4185)
VSLTLKELVQWPPEIGELAKATRDMGGAHSGSAQFYRDVAQASTWGGQAGSEAMQAMLTTAGQHTATADNLGKAAAAMDRAEQAAERVAQKVRAIIKYADEDPAVEIDESTNRGIAPDTTHMDSQAAQAVSEKVADLEARIADVLDEADVVDGDLARAIATATGLPEPAAHNPVTLTDLLLPPVGPGMSRGQARNLGPVAGTGSDGAIPGVGAADLGEVVQLPNGKYVAIFGDAFKGDHVGADPHYPSVAVPVAFDAKGRAHFGVPLTGPQGSPNVLFPPPPEIGGRNTLPAGTIRMRDGTTYMMVAGTDPGLKPGGGSYLVKVTNDPAGGWTRIDNSWRPWTTMPDPAHPGEMMASPTSHPTQISGYQAADGTVYIAADSFDRTRPVTMYSVDPEHVADRSAWQPWTGNGWGTAGEVASTPVSPGRNFGELSFREVDGRPVLAGFNASNGPGAVEVQVGTANPTDIFAASAPTTIVMQQGDPTAPNFIPQNYGGFILPGSTLDNLNLFGSQWHTPTDAQGRPIGPEIYNTQQIVVNANR